MVVSIDTHAKTIQLLWDKGIRSAREICKRTGLPRSTVYYNLAKLKKRKCIIPKA